MRHGLWLSTVIALAMLLAPEVAFGEGGAGGDDEVDLKNGGMVRGTIVSLEPDKEVVILVGGTGQQRRIAWAEVDKVKRGKSAAPPTSPKASADDDDEAPAHKGKHGKKPAASSDDDDDEAPAHKEKHEKKPSGDDDEDDEAPAQAPTKRGAPRLHIETDQPVTLHEVTMTVGMVGPGGSAYGVFSKPVCESPCDKVINGRAGQRFYFAGDGIPASSGFQLTDKKGDVTVHVDPGSTGLRAGGIAVLGLGGAAIATGASLLIVGVVINNTTTFTIGPDGMPVTEKRSSSLPLVGGVTLGLGVAALVGGIVMVVSGRTKYDFRNASIPGLIRF